MQRGVMSGRVTQQKIELVAQSKEQVGYREGRVSYSYSRGNRRVPRLESFRATPLPNHRDQLLILAIRWLSMDGCSSPIRILSLLLRVE